MLPYASRSTDARTGKLRFRYVPGYGWYRDCVATYIQRAAIGWERDLLANGFREAHHIDSVMRRRSSHPSKGQI